MLNSENNEINEFCQKNRECAPDEEDGIRCMPQKPSGLFKQPVVSSSSRYGRSACNSKNTGIIPMKTGVIEEEKLEESKESNEDIESDSQTDGRNYQSFGMNGGLQGELWKGDIKEASFEQADVSS